MIRHAAVLAVTACLTAPALAQCPDNTLTNGGFEDPDPDFPSFPLGWAEIPAGEPIWASGIARTGNRSIGLAPPNLGSFIAWHTDLFDPNGDLYNPPYEYLGGDLHVSGYYMTPVGQGLGAEGQPPDDVVGIKLEFRRVPPNFSIYQSFEFHIPLGSTNGEWLPYEIIFPADQISPDFPPFPGSVTILPFRFVPFGVFPTGIIYWDDLCVWQETDCPPDLNGDGIVDNGDIAAFIALFLAQDLAVDFNGDGLIDNGDIAEFIAQFLAGC